MVQVTVDMDVSEITKDLNPEQLQQVKRKGLEYTSQEMVRTLMMNSPVDHGVLKSWFIESISDDEAHIKTPAKYARFVNDGTSPHIIRPVYKKALYWQGASHPVKMVHHPGIKGRHFVEDSIETVQAKADDYFLRALSEVLG